MWRKENGTFDSGFIIYMFNVNDVSYQIGTFLFYQIQLRVMQKSLFKMLIFIVEMDLKCEGQMC